MGGSVIELQRKASQRCGAFFMARIKNRGENHYQTNCFQGAQNQHYQ
jgi:hypothetical protein